MSSARSGGRQRCEIVAVITTISRARLCPVPRLQIK